MYNYIYIYIKTDLFAFFLLLINTETRPYDITTLL